MTPAFEPRPGSVADRVLAYLRSQPPGTELITSNLAEGINAEPSGLSTCLAPALEAGAIYRRQKDKTHVRAPFFWSLTDHTCVNGTAKLVDAQDESSVDESAETLDRAVRTGLAAEAHALMATDRAPWPSVPQAIARQLGQQKETLALRAAVPETTAEAADSGDAQRADDRGQPQGDASSAEVVVPFCAPPVAISATPDASNRHCIPPRPGPQHVLKAEAATPDATDREPGLFRCALWSTGELVLQSGGDELVLDGDATRKLVAYLDQVLLDRGEDEASLATPHCGNELPPSVCAPALRAVSDNAA